MDSAKNIQRAYVEKVVCAFVRAIEALPRSKQIYASKIVLEIGNACAGGIQTQTFRHLERRIVALVEKIGVGGDDLTTALVASVTREGG
jgi:hypothetical protein